MAEPSGGNRYAPWYVRAAIAGAATMVVYVAGGGDLLHGAGVVGCKLFRSACTADSNGPEQPKQIRLSLPEPTTVDYGPSYTGLRRP